MKIFLLFSLFIVIGCSKESVKRTSYETLQNIREQECNKTPSVDCEKRERFETYEQQRLDKENTE